MFTENQQVKTKTTLGGWTTSDSGRGLRKFTSVHNIEIGVILETIPFNRLYRVALEAGPIAICTYIGDSGFLLFSVHDQTVLPVGSKVIVYKRPGETYGVILGVIPDFILNTNFHFPDDLVQGSNVGFIGDHFYRDVLYSQPIGGGGLPAWTGAHVDALSGEWARLASTGLGLAVAPFVGTLRANEYCGVWVHFPNSLLRTVGFNYQHWTGGTEEFVFIDKLNVWKYRGCGYSLDHQLGKKFLRPRIRGAFTEVNNNESVVSRASNIEHQTVFRGETKTLSRFPIHIIQEWEGIVGGGQFKTVFKNIFRSNTETLFPMAQQIITASGIIGLQSSAGIFLAKYPFISTIFRKNDPDEKLGEISAQTIQAKTYSMMDKLATKMFVGEWPAFDASKVSLYDIHNYVFNWEAQAGFHMYPKKFKFFREVDNFYISRKSLSLRPGIGDPFTRASFIFMDPFGNISLQNGCGAKIELIGENIRITAPKGVYIDSGKEIKTYSKDTKQYSEEHYINIAGKTVNLGAQKSDASGSSVSYPELLVLDSGNQGILKAKYLSIDTGEIRNCTTPTSYTTNLSKGKYPVQPWVYNYTVQNENNNLKTSIIVDMDSTLASYEPETLVDGNGFAASCPTDYNNVELLNISQQIYANAPKVYQGSSSSKQLKEVKYFEKDNL